MAVRAGFGVRSLGCRLASHPQLPARVGGHVFAARWVSMVPASEQCSGAWPPTHVARMGVPVKEKDTRSIANLARMEMMPGRKAGQPPFHAATFASLTKPQIRDPEKPKRPLSGWLRFAAKFRLENKDSQLKGKDVLIQAGNRWKSMTAIEKKPFEDAAAPDARKYKEALRQYVDSGKKDAWRRDPAKPKRPMTPFFKFAHEFRQKHPGLKVTEGTKQAKTAWEVTPDAEKDAYTKQYAKEREKYSAETEAYKKSGKQEAWEKKVGIYEAKEKLALQKQKAKEATEKLKAKAKAARGKAKAAAAAAKAKANAAREKAKAAAAAAKTKASAMKGNLQQRVAKASAKSKAAIAKPRAFTTARAEKAAEKKTSQEPATKAK